MCLQLAAASYYIYIHDGLRKRWRRQQYTSREVYGGSSLLADWNFQSVSGSYKNFTKMSPIEFEFLINLIGERIPKKGHSVQASHFCSRKFGADALIRRVCSFLSAVRPMQLAL